MGKTNGKIEIERKRKVTVLIELKRKIETEVNQTENRQIGLWLKDQINLKEKNDIKIEKIDLNRNAKTQRQIARKITRETNNKVKIDLEITLRITTETKIILTLSIKTQDITKIAYALIKHEHRSWSCPTLMPLHFPWMRLFKQQQDEHIPVAQDKQQTRGIHRKKYEQIGQK